LTIPPSWKKYSEAGIIRIDSNTQTIYKPYPFLEQFWKKRAMIFAVSDIEHFLNIGLSFMSTDKIKGYYFQFGVAVELNFQHQSKFLKEIINRASAIYKTAKILKSDLTIIPLEPQERKIHYFTEDNKIDRKRLCMVRDIRKKN